MAWVGTPSSPPRRRVYLDEDFPSPGPFFLLLPQTNWYSQVDHHRLSLQILPSLIFLVLLLPHLPSRTFFYPIFSHLHSPIMSSTFSLLARKAHSKSHPKSYHLPGHQHLEWPELSPAEIAAIVIAVVIVIIIVMLVLEYCYGIPTFSYVDRKLRKEIRKEFGEHHETAENKDVELGVLVQQPAPAHVRPNH
ncbi:hypothetical protein F4780DRAFT_2911 [Xylariomycetidae sp. FL0641]|nr:hypothetical protein F4780DRAFT_2911 [Xylariomycetidae sp. FL0641]